MSLDLIELILKKLIFFCFFKGHTFDRTTSVVNKHALTTTRVKSSKKRDQFSSSGKETSASQTDADNNFAILEILADSSEYKFLQIWQNSRKYPIISMDLCKTAISLVHEQWRYSSSCTKNYTIAPVPVKPYCIIE